MKFATFFTVYVIVLALSTAWAVLYALSTPNHHESGPVSIIAGAGILSLTGSLAAMYAVRSRNNR